MKKIILSLAVCLMATVVNAQTTVKGVLIDEALGEGEPFATVRVMKEGSEKPVTSFLTDVEGRFSHAVNGKGKYDVVFSSIGKEDLHHSVELTGSGVLDLGTLYMKENATALKGVEVVGQKPLVKMEVDKMTYNVAEDDDAKASTVLDMLRKVPMVTVDGQDNISVNGSSSFKVYVDGKPNVMFSSNPSVIFKSMPATAVKNIEVVTNPGAKYDAEGASGVLNIVLNKEAMGGAGGGSMNGYNGTLTAAVGTNSWGGGAFVSGQQGKLTYSVDVMHQKMSPKTTKTTSLMEQGTISQLSEIRTKTRLPFTMGSLSLGYEIDSVSSVSLSAELTSMSMKNTGGTTTSLLVGGYPASTYYNNLMLKNKETGFSGSADYQRFFNKERTSWIALAYQLSYAPNQTKQRNDFYAETDVPIDITDRLSDNREKTLEHTFQTDYTTPLGGSQTLNLGAKLMLRRATSDADYYLDNVFTEDLSMDYTYKNRIGAAYAEYETKWNKVGAKAGLRYEHTWQDVEYKLDNDKNFSTDYGNLVPSANLSYSMAPTMNLGLTYNMRISRPGITYLNPYVDRSTPTALTYGNTDLDVEKTHNVALVFNSFSQKLMLNVNLSHNFTDNAIEQFSFQKDDVLNTTYGNIVKRHQTAMNVYANWLVHKNTRLFMNSGVRYVDLRSSQLDVKNSGWSANVMAGLQQTLPWDLKLSTYIISRTKTYTLQGWSGGMNLFIGTLSKSLFDDKLSLSLQGLTGLNDGGCLKMETYSSGKDFTNHMNIRVPLYGITFNVQYTFGNTKKQFAQQSRKTRIENDYIEQKSQGEMIQGAGAGNMSN